MICNSRSIRCWDGRGKSHWGRQQLGTEESEVHLPFVKRRVRTSGFPLSICWTSLLSIPKTSNLPLTSVYVQTIQVFAIFNWVPDVPLLPIDLLDSKSLFEIATLPRELLCQIFLPFHGEDRRYMTQTTSISAVLQPTYNRGPSYECPAVVWIYSSLPPPFSPMSFGLFP